MILAFALGLCTPIPIRFGGVLYVGETLLFGVAVWVILTRLHSTAFWTPVSKRFVVLMLLSLGSYIVTDVFRQTPSEDFLRGWSKIAFMTTNFVALYYLTKNNSAAFPWFFVGLESASVVADLLRADINVAYTFGAYWKFVYSHPLTLIPLCVLAAFRKFGIRLSGYFLVLIGALHVVLDYRSLGIMCLLVAAVLIAATRSRTGVIKVNWRMLVLSAICACAALTFLYVRSQGEYGERRDASNSWRFGTTMALIKGIQRSPILGNGSWSSDPQMEAWRDEFIESRGVNRYAAGKSETFTGHSEVFQAWYEGGILTVALFSYYAYQLFLVTRYLLRRPLDHLSAVFLFWVLLMIYGYFFNPFNGLIRVDIALGFAMVCFLRAEEKNRLERRYRTVSYAPSQAPMGGPAPYDRSHFGPKGVSAGTKHEE